MNKQILMNKQIHFTEERFDGFNFHWQRNSGNNIIVGK